MTEFILVDSLYEKYTLGFEKGTTEVFVECATCDAVVCVLDYEDIKSLNATELYEEIMDSHRKI